MLRELENFCYPGFWNNIYDHKKYYPGEPVNIHIQSLINIIQENNWEITTKKGKGKLSLFFGNGERAIHLYGGTRCLTL